MIVKPSLKARDVSQWNVERDQSCDMPKEKFVKSMRYQMILRKASWARFEQNAPTFGDKLCSMESLKAEVKVPKHAKETEEN